MIDLEFFFFGGLVLLAAFAREAFYQAKGHGKWRFRGKEVRLRSE